MTVSNNNDTNHFYHHACIVMIWCTVVYSSIIQSKFYQIPNGMLLFGFAILISFALANRGMLIFQRFLTKESEYMLYFMAYMLLSGLLFSPNKSSHLSQWITCMEYLFIQIVICSMMKDSGTNAFHIMLLAEAMALAVVFLKAPVNYINSGRYSISNEVNPNTLGMELAAGIWAVLYWQHKKTNSLILTGAVVALFGYCILMTGSRKAMIAAGLILVLWLFFCFLPSLKGRGLWLGAISFLVLTVLVIVIGQQFLNLYTGSKMANRMVDLTYDVSEGNRSNMYREGYELLKTNPLFGIGFTGFEYNFGTYSHATLVEIPVSGGIIGAILYFRIYYVSLKKTIILFKNTKGLLEYEEEHKSIKMILILWAVMLFYTICIIHAYQFDSFILFGIIFGETAYIEGRLSLKQEMKQETSETKRIRCRYIRYE